jgi:hypothetical protein
VPLRGEGVVPNLRRIMGELLAQNQNPIAHVGASRVMPARLMATKCLPHELFTGKVKDTQDNRRRIPERFCDCGTPSGRRFGDNFFRGITTANIQAGIKGRPRSQPKPLGAGPGQLGIALNAEGSAVLRPQVVELFQTAHALVKQAIGAPLDHALLRKLVDMLANDAEVRVSAGFEVRWPTR